LKVGQLQVSGSGCFVADGASDALLRGDNVAVTWRGIAGSANIAALSSGLVGGSSAGLTIHLGEHDITEAGGGVRRSFELTLLRPGKDDRALLAREGLRDIEPEERAVVTVDDGGQNSSVGCGRRLCVNWYDQSWRLVRAFRERDTTAVR